MKRKSETMELLWCQIRDIDGIPKPSGSPLAHLRRVAEPSVDETIRERAAVEFNDHIKYRWRSRSRAFPLTDDEKDPIKTLIVPLVLSPNSSPTIDANLRQALAIIGIIDFPRFWPALLPDLTSRLETAIEADDFASVNRVLAALNSLLKKFSYIRNVTDPIRLDLRYCLDNFCDPLLKTVQIISAKIDSASGSGFEVASSSKFRLLIEAQLLCFNMFYSLNFIDLPGFFVKPVDKWMNEFKNYLNVSGDQQLDELQSAVFENIGLYIKKQDPSFQDYFQPFVEAVIGVFVDSEKPLALTAIEFLTQVVTSSGGSGWFYHEHMLQQQITEKVVVPNMLLGDDDEELFHKDYLEYIRRDMDPNSRRRITCQLLKGIVASSGYAKAIQKLIQNWLASFAENPTANWRYKDCAICLVLSYNREPTPIVDVEGFFRSAIVPELQRHDVNSFPILKAAALKFFTKFWLQVPGMDFVSDVVRLLGSDANVVHSYAAIFIKKRLLLKDKGRQALLVPILPVLSKNLFDALEKRGSEENKYVMHCILQVGAISPCGIISSTPVVILNWFSCENPKRPDRLFEAFNYLVTRSYKDLNPLVPALDIWILPSVRMILDKRVREFFPYALRLLARLLDYGTYEVPPHYKRSIFDILNMLIIQLILG